MSIKATDQVYVLEAVVDRLIAENDTFSEDNCWLSDQAVPRSIPNGRFAITVSVGGGRFPHEYYTGSQTVLEDGAIVIAPIVVTKADRPGRAWKKIGNSQPNEGDAPTLISLKRAILKTLLPPPSTWEPEHEGVPILRDMIQPLDCSEPGDVHIGQTVAAMLRIRFSTVFDWDLS